MKFLLLCVFVGLAAAQFGHIGELLGNLWRWGGGDNIHGYHFEFHTQHNLLLVRTSSACYALNVDQSTADMLKHKDSREKVEDDLYKLIKAGGTFPKTTMHDLQQTYHDIRADVECRHHDIFTLTYTPSSN